MSEEDESRQPIHCVAAARLLRDSETPMKLVDAFKASMACHNPHKPDYETPYAYLEDWHDLESGVNGPVAVYYWAGTWRGVRTPSYPRYGAKLMRLKEADAYFGHRADWKPYLDDDALPVGPRM